jgi:hypothetical protein
MLLGYMVRHGRDALVVANATVMFEGMSSQRPLTLPT